MLHSDRLLLRAIEPADADFMYEVENDAAAWRYGDTVAPLSRRMLREYALGYEADPFSAGQLRLIIVSSDSGAPIGIADLYELSQRHGRAFVGIYILPGFRRRGFAGEALALLETYAREILHMHQLAAKIVDSNKTSMLRFSALGYECRGKLPEWLAGPDRNYSDMLIYTKLLDGGGQLSEGS